MIDFTTKQLSWLIITATGIGGGGYMTMNQKIDGLSEKVSVSYANQINMDRNFERLEKQLGRIEEKIDNSTLKRNK